MCAIAGGRFAHDSMSHPGARRWVDLCEQALRLAPDERGQALLRYLDAVLQVAEADLDRPVEQARAALDYLSAHDAPTEMRSLLALLLQAETARGRPAATIHWADEALDRSGDSTSRATVLVARAECLSKLGRTVDALADLHEAAGLARGVDDDMAHVNEGTALSALGQAYEALGALPAAIEAHRDALRVARSVGHTRGEATELASLGVVLGKLAPDPARPTVRHREQVAMRSRIRRPLAQRSTVDKAGRPDSPAHNREATTVARQSPSRPLMVSLRRSRSLPGSRRPMQ
jgi:tetratricopeptide (TPR) repeat protein